MIESGEVFAGENFGYPGEFYGELVFNTGMTGYQEIATDPSYRNQIIIFTYPEIGNYGILDSDNESDKVQAQGLIVHRYNERYSHPDAICSLGEFLRAHKKGGIAGLDTRELTRLVREKGNQKAIISTQPNPDVKALFNRLRQAPHPINHRNLVADVSTKKAYVWNDKNQKRLKKSTRVQKDYRYKIAVYDYGVKHNILRLLEAENCEVCVFPSDASAQKISDYKADGLLLSNGPGDPTTLSYAVENVKQLLGKIPIFGICFGHQILAQACNLEIYKLKFGHRGINQPVRQQKDGTIEITSQNHGFAVKNTTSPLLAAAKKDTHKTSAKTLYKSSAFSCQSSHVHLNDMTLSGISLSKLFAFSVQYHPEASPGPHDSQYLFAQFMEMIAKFKKSRF